MLRTQYDYVIKITTVTGHPADRCSHFITSHDSYPTMNQASESSVRTRRTQGASEAIPIASEAPWTTVTQLTGANTTAFKTVATLIERAQIHDRKKCRADDWSLYPTNCYAFIAYGGEEGVRFLGVGDEKHVTQQGEDEKIFKLNLPFTGCGRDLAEMIGVYKFHSDLMEKHNGRRTGSVDTSLAHRVLIRRAS